MFSPPEKQLPCVVMGRWLALWWQSLCTYKCSKSTRYTPSCQLRLNKAGKGWCQPTLDRPFSSFTRTVSVISAEKQQV